MVKVLVLYHSMYGHIETMANKIAEGARSVPGAEVVVKRVPETMSLEAFAAAGGKTNQSAPEAQPSELADFDAIIFGTPTRFGNMSGQMRNFLDRTGGLWAKGALAGKVASVINTHHSVSCRSESKCQLLLTCLQKYLWCNAAGLCRTSPHRICATDHAHNRLLADRHCPQPRIL